MLMFIDLSLFYFISILYPSYHRFCMSFDEFYKIINLIPFSGHPVINIFFSVLFFYVAFNYRWSNNKVLTKIYHIEFLIMIIFYSMVVWLFMLYHHVPLFFYKNLFFHFCFYFLAVYIIVIIISIFILKIQK